MIQIYLFFFCVFIVEFKLTIFSLCWKFLWISYEILIASVFFFFTCNIVFEMINWDKL